MGPHWWLKRAIEQVYNDGFRNMNLRFILVKLCAPVIAALGMALAMPYVISKSIVPALGFSPSVQNLVLRRIYPTLLATIIMIVASIFQARQFKRLYEHIKNDKYLVGQRLVNYEPKKPFTGHNSPSFAGMTFSQAQQPAQQQQPAIAAVQQQQQQQQQQQEGNIGVDILPGPLLQPAGAAPGGNAGLQQRLV
ncbi:MARCH6 [Acanthosepion pharaonis]|uniref:RING-type E3 ubiquitin transferase n=1 Tax=Acanthosepion pharaonis TaxID=158019 RepID=A0A812B3S0_ACAPH|nr:MARCH6 [Sepia pharaonis]